MQRGEVRVDALSGGKRKKTGTASAGKKGVTSPKHHSREENSQLIPYLKQRRRKGGKAPFSRQDARYR